jgi:hypothetical protein
MDAARDGMQQLLAAESGEVAALSDRVSSLFDDVAPFVLPLLPLDTRARRVRAKGVACCSRGYVAVE